MLKLGTQNISALYVGENKIKRAYWGGDLVYEKNVSLNSCTWEQINELSKSGELLQHFSIGDTKTVVLNGKVGATTFNNAAIDLVLVGYDHNRELESPNEHRAHFLIGMRAGELSALVDSMYTKVINTPGYFSITTSFTDEGGWGNSQMRKNIMSALKNALPADLRAVMKPVTKYTDNTGGSDKESNVTATTEEICIPAEFEVFGTINHANPYEQQKQMQYQYFADGTSKIFYKYNESTLKEGCWVWTRSASPIAAYYFVYINQNGESNIYGTPVSYGIAPLIFV